MEIFPYIADNRIGRIYRFWACVMSVLLLGILLTGCLDGQRTEEPVTEVCETDVDAVTQAAPEPEEDDTDGTGIRLRDLASAASHPDEQQTLLRERNRTDTDYRILAFKEQEEMDWRRICFDLQCKMNVSESKVRQGIFHFRLQSDDEEAGPSAARQVA